MLIGHLQQRRNGGVLSVDLCTPLRLRFSCHARSLHTFVFVFVFSVYFHFVFYCDRKFIHVDNLWPVISMQSTFL